MRTSSCGPMVIVAGLLLLLLTAATGATMRSEGRITDVTVYRDQARITRSIEITAEPGPLTVLAGELPEHIVPSSLSAKSSGDCTVHSLTYRTRAVTGDTRPQVKAIDAEISQLRVRIKELEAYHELLQQKRAIIDRLQRFTADTAERELQQGVLDFEQLRQLTEYGLSQRDQLTCDSLELEQTQRQTLERLRLLERQRAELATGYSKTQREALIHVTIHTTHPVTLQLRYQVTHVAWYPQYNLRSDQDRRTVTLEYNAGITQRSGEDWDRVRLTLSTAEPTFAAEAPVIAPLVVSVGSGQELPPEEVERTLEGVRQKRVAEQRANVSAAQLSEALNVYAGKEQVLELTQKADVLHAVRKSLARQEGVSATYHLPEAVTLSSRADEQILQIMAVTVPARFEHVAAPVLTDFVFERATASNTTTSVLLPGPYSAYLDGQFVGQGTLQLTAGGGEFTVGFGVDPQVQVQRRLLSKTERVEGGNLVSSFDYLLTASSYRTDSVPLRLEDRIPYCPDGSVRVELLDSKPEVSVSPQYRREELPKGMLRWDLMLPANAVKDRAVTVRYRFEMAHDRQMKVIGGPQP